MQQRNIILPGQSGPVWSGTGLLLSGQLQYDPSILILVPQQALHMVGTPITSQHCHLTKDPHTSILAKVLDDALIPQLTAITHNLVLTYFILLRGDSEIWYFYAFLYNVQGKSKETNTETN